MILKFRQAFISFVFCTCVLLGGASVWAQTSAFTYQGKLTDNAMAANRNYQIRFGLFDAASAGNQVGSTVANPTVNVANGVFTVNLDFDAAAFKRAKAETTSATVDFD